MTTVKEIIIVALREMGADGLCEGECGCGLDNLMPCGTAPIWCVPAKEVPVPEELQGDYDQYFEPMTEEEIAANLNMKLCHDMKCGDPYKVGDHSHHYVTGPESHKNGGDRR